MKRLRIEDAIMSISNDTSYLLEIRKSLLNVKIHMQVSKLSYFQKYPKFQGMTFHQCVPLLPVASMPYLLHSPLHFVPYIGQLKTFNSTTRVKKYYAISFECIPDCIFMRQHMVQLLQRLVLKCVYFKSVSSEQLKSVSIELTHQDNLCGHPRWEKIIMTRISSPFSKNSWTTYCYPFQ